MHSAVSYDNFGFGRYIILVVQSTYYLPLIVEEIYILHSRFSN